MSRRDDKRFAIAVEEQTINLAANSGYRVHRTRLSADGRNVEFWFEPTNQAVKDGAA